MGGPAATIGSMHICPMCNGTVPHVGGPVTGPGSPNVFINGKPAAVMGDMCTCAGPPDTIVQGEATVLINGKPAATVGCMTAHGGTITVGEPTVLIGTGASARTEIMPVKKIPFPEIKIIKKVVSSVAGRSKQLNEAIANQEALKKQAEKQPEILVSNLQWEKEGKIIEKANVNEKVILKAEVKGVEDGKYIPFLIYEKDEQGEDDYVDSVLILVENGKAKAEWKVKYVEDTDDFEAIHEMQEKGYTLPEFVFKYVNRNGETVESGVLTVEDCLEIKAIDEETGKPLANVNISISLPNGEFLEEQLDDNGYIKLEELRASKNYPIVFYNDKKIYSTRY